MPKSERGRTKASRRKGYFKDFVETVVTAVVLAVTIIGIPFAWAHVKLAGIALWPIGKTIVPA